MFYVRIRRAWGRVVNAPLWTHLAAILVLAAGLRIACFAASCEDPSARQMEEDSNGYLTLASNLAEGKGFARFRSLDGGKSDVWLPELSRTPGYPAIIATLDLVTGHGRFAVVLLQNILGIALCPLGTIILRRVAGAAPGLIAGIFLALDAQGIALANLVMTEGIFTFLIFMAAVATARTAVTSSPWLATLTGVLFGLATTIRPVAAALPALIMIFMLIYAARTRQIRLATAALVLALSGGVIVSACVVRNGIVCGEYTLSSVGRYNLLYVQASRVLARGEEIGLADAQNRLESEASVEGAAFQYVPLSEEECARARRVALATFVAYPAAFARELAEQTLLLLLGPEKQLLTILGMPQVTFGIRTPASNLRFDRAGVACVLLLAVQIPYTLLIYLGVMKAAWATARGRRFPSLVYVALCTAIYLLATSSLLPDTRFRGPAIPLLILVAAAALPSHRACRQASANNGIESCGMKEWRPQSDDAQ
jgi:hypothetical protein